MGKTLGTIGKLAQDTLDAKERATLKGAEIAKIGKVERTKVGDLELEVVSMNAIPGGVEVFARVWDEKGQIGFGPDGTVDIERFRIFNPPILVPDGTKELRTDEKGHEYEVDNFKEDPQEALLQSLAHTISVKKERFSSDLIQPLKVGNTTSTFYPTVDGYARKVGTSTNWEGVQNVNGDSSDYAADNVPMFIEAFSDGSQWFQLVRGLVGFDTSAIGDTDTISAATLSFYGSDKTETASGFSAVYEVTISEGSTASTTTIADSDYQATRSAGTTEFVGTRKSYAGWSVGSYNDFTLDADGIGNIDKTGQSTFAMRIGADFDNSPYSIPASGDRYTRVNWSTSEVAGTSQDPKLVVEHTSGDLDINVFESVTITESVTMMVDENPNVNDAITLTEAVTMMADENIDVFDAVTVTESVSLEVYTPVDPTVFDGVSVSEDVQVVIEQLVPSVFDAVTVSESVSLVIPAAPDGLIHMRSKEQSYPLMMDEDEIR